ncbi:M23 family metallopeptidase [Corallincola luteus]|uniref:M23 family metallopeptidase n=1 Tax=Corallincola luteus TaxID=1775177 RepID=A0ABY2ALX0_9GAMM|nr:M23 family metallopeptidase [Corallincola luteus]TCI03595.1 M23 family metallopeptidase [Corallincola luteus]
MSVSVSLKTRNREYHLNLGAWHIGGFFVAVVLLAATFVSTQLNQLDPIRLKVAEKRIENESQVVQLDELRQATARQLQQLAGRVGLLQAHTQRLEALGSRLTDLHELDSTEFDFAAEPPVGGPINIDTADEVIEPGEQLGELLAKIDELSSQLNNRTRQLALLENLLLNHQISDESYVSGRPISDGWLSSYFGTRTDPFTRKPAHHKGIDFAGKEGGDVVATGAGIVTWSAHRGGYGELVEINHGAGLSTRYGHNQTLLVKVGDVVTKGQVIARMGSTGRSTGPHVHYEVLKHGRQIDPIKYVYRKAK